MGLNHSKVHLRVTKVKPLQNKEAEIPSAGSTHLPLSQKSEEKSSYSFEILQHGNKALEGQLPPLRESWYGGHTAVPTAMYFDIPLEQREISIIKRHPPRRLQKLESIDLPQVITAERCLSQQEARTRTRYNAKELEKKMPTSMYASGKRQYLHKMQMLEMNRNRQEAQMKLKKILPREARNNKQKLRNHKAKETLQSIPKNGGYNILTILPDETMHRGSGNYHDAEFLDYQERNEYCHQKNDKMETWPRDQEAGGEFLWDSSSSDSDEQENDGKNPCPLVRTRTEKILLFDEFFDRE
ncbi:factor associated with metabolism and energy [Thomomys bottae]